MRIHLYVLFLCCDFVEETLTLSCNHALHSSFVVYVAYVVYAAYLSRKLICEYYLRANILCVAACEEEISVLKDENMLNMMSLVAGSVGGT